MPNASIFGLVSTIQSWIKRIEDYQKEKKNRYFSHIVTVLLTKTRKK